MAERYASFADDVVSVCFAFCIRAKTKRKEYDKNSARVSAFCGNKVSGQGHREIKGTAICYISAGP